MGPLALVRSRDDERNGHDRICPWPLLWIICGVWKADPLFRQNSTENGISTVYKAFYACEFPATSEPLLSPYSTLIQPLANR